MSTLKVNSLRSTTASSDGLTLDGSGNITAPGNTTCSGTLAVTKELTAKNFANRNLIINGAMQVAQRSSAAVNDNGMETVDRFRLDYSGTDNNPTQAQHALTSSDTGPWEKGFRYSWQITNGDQSSGAGAADYIEIKYNMEAQDLANSGWDYTSASSYITLSFWVKSSVAQTFYGYIDTIDGTGQRYSFSFALSANTWTKVIKTIPGAANITVNNDNGKGLQISFVPFYGTDYTNNNTLDTWAEKVTGNYFPDQTSTWWTTDDATFELTGVQLEVGEVATEFEHRSYGDELLRCMRYCQRYDTGGDTWVFVAQGNVDGDNETFPLLKEFQVPMRVKPSSMATTGTASDYYVRRDSSKACSAVPTFNAPGPYSVQVLFKSASHGWETGHNVKGYLKDSGAYLLFSAEF